MAECDLCGREAELVRAEVEDSVLNVCAGCGKYGKVLGKVKSPEEIKKVLAPKKRVVREEIEEAIMSDYAQKIRRAREKRGMKREDFAKMLNEKESLVEKWEKGLLRPRVEVARRLEKRLRVELVERVEEQKVSLEKIKSEEMTLGDVIKIRRRS